MFFVAEWKMATKVDHYSDRHVVGEDNWEDGMWQIEINRRYIIAVAFFKIFVVFNFRFRF